MGSAPSPNTGNLSSNPFPDISGGTSNPMNGVLPTTGGAQFMPAPQFGAQNPGEFAMGGMMGPSPSVFQPDLHVLQQGGSAATPYGFGSPNPYSEFFGGGGGNNGQMGSLNDMLMSALMGQTPTQPNMPQSVPSLPVNVPSISYGGAAQPQTQVQGQMGQGPQMGQWGQPVGGQQMAQMPGQPNFYTPNPYYE